MTDSQHFVDKYWTYSHPEKLYARHEGGKWDDGWPHERDADGWCTNCGVPPGVHHARLKRRAEGDTPESRLTNTA